MNKGIEKVIWNSWWVDVGGDHANLPSGGWKEYSRQIQSSGGSLFVDVEVGRLVI